MDWIFIQRFHFQRFFTSKNAGKTQCALASKDFNSFHVSIRKFSNENWQATQLKTIKKVKELYVLNSKYSYRDQGFFIGNSIELQR